MWQVQEQESLLWLEPGDLSSKPQGGRFHEEVPTHTQTHTHTE